MAGVILDIGSGMDYLKLFELFSERNKAISPGTLRGIPNIFLIFHHLVSHLSFLSSTFKIYLFIWRC